METLRNSAAMEQFLLPTATILLALHSAMLFLSAVGHLFRQRLSPAAISASDVGLSATLLLLGSLLVVGHRVLDGRDEASVHPGRFRLVVLVTAVTESVLAAAFYWTILANPTNGVSDFILALVATSGLFTAGVLLVSTGQISKRA